MDVVKRLLGLTNCHGEQLLDGRNLQACLNSFHLQYLGYIFSNQPDSSEVQRAYTCLVSRPRKAFVFTFADDTMIGIDASDVSNFVQLKMHRVVFSCVDAKNQKIVAVFYHNSSNPNRDLHGPGLECHLIMGKSKEQARKFAERIADELIYTYRRRRKLNMVALPTAPTRALASYVNYENCKLRPKKETKKSGTNTDVFSGSTSTFSKSSCTTVASIETGEQISSISLLDSLQDLDVPMESVDDPSSKPKPEFMDSNVTVHKDAGSELNKLTNFNIADISTDLDSQELACLVDMTETDI